MGNARYNIVQLTDDLFEIFEDGIYLVKFKRSNFRTSLEVLNRSSNWTGSILRLYLKKYPPPRVHPIRTDFDRLYDKIGETGFVDYLRSKGLRVVKPLQFNDMDIIKFLESRGYVIEGLTGDYYYSTETSKAIYNIDISSII
jgi:hypothetical protein